MAPGAEIRSGCAAGGDGCKVRAPPSEAGRSSVLVLTRKSNQSIMIGDDIEVSVLSIMGEKVRIGIQAPRDIPVFRKEVYLEIQQERAAELAGSGARTEVEAALRQLGQQVARAAPRGRGRLSPSRGTAPGTSPASRGRRSPAARARAATKRSEPGLWRRSRWRRCETMLGLAQLALAALAVGLGLLDERALELGQALSHAFRHRRAGYYPASSALQSPRPARRASAAVARSAPRSARWAGSSASARSRRARARR